jgi:hypothetical protein
MDMQGFVHRNRAASPQQASNGPRINPERQAIAANAKVSLKRDSAAQQAHTLGAPSSHPYRGVGNAQNSSATIQHAPQRRQPGQAHQPDPYGTDAESIDTTVNQSVIQLEDSQTMGHHHQQQDGVAYQSEESGDEGSDDEEDEEYPLTKEHPLTQEESDYLIQQGQEHLKIGEAIEFLVQNGRRGFGTVDGDSYPSTTDGHPTEWERAPEPSSEAYDNGAVVSLSPRPTTANVQQPLAPPSMHRGTFNAGAGQTAQRPSKVFQQSAQLRDQQRVNTFRQQPPGFGIQPNAAPMQSNQPPSYSQASREPAAVQTTKPQTRPNHQVAFFQPGEVPQRRPGPHFAAAQPFRAAEAPIATKRSSQAHDVVVPVIQHQPMEAVSAQDSVARPGGDYDPEVLNKMAYEELKNESFDTDPRGVDQPLSDEMLQKPLVERLTHVQNNFDSDRQAKFFQALPTGEWEDAGDWFLDKFSNIIQRTREARQAKRKLAQEFEDEIEKRHKHVNKKQQQVDNALSKMQAQGEGLMPRSPKRSKSPKPRKRGQ